MGDLVNLRRFSRFQLEPVIHLWATAIKMDINISKSKKSTKISLAWLDVGPTLAQRRANVGPTSAPTNCQCCGCLGVDIFTPTFLVYNVRT